MPGRHGKVYLYTDLTYAYCIYGRVNSGVPEVQIIGAPDPNRDEGISARPPWQAPSQRAGQPGPAAHAEPKIASRLPGGTGVLPGPGADRRPSSGHGGRPGGRRPET